MGDNIDSKVILGNMLGVKLLWGVDIESRWGVFWAGYTRKGILQGKVLCKVMCIVTNITQICFHSPPSFNNACCYGLVKLSSRMSPGFCVITTFA